MSQQRIASFIVSAQAKVYKEFTVSIRATLTCSDPSYTKEFSLSIPCAFLEGQEKKAVVDATLGEIFAEDIKAEIQSQNLNPNACRVSYSASCADPGVSIFISEDGLTPSQTERSKVWAALQPEPVEYTIEADLSIPGQTGEISVSSISQDKATSLVDTVVVSGELRLRQQTGSGCWEEKHPAQSPPPRYEFAMAYDSYRGKIVLFGGMDANGNRLNDTWEYDGVNWVRIETPNSPPPMDGHAMAYDPVRRRMVLYGGAISYTLPDGTSSWTYNRTMWEYDGSNWIQIDTSTFPSQIMRGRAGHRMIWNPKVQKILMFGGYGYHESSKMYRNLGDAWYYDGSRWTFLSDVTTKNPPYGVSGHTMVYDEERNEIFLMFGKQAYAGATKPSTFRWSSTSWYYLIVNYQVPPGDYDCHAADYSGVLRKTVLFGGYGVDPDKGFIMSDQTWEFDGYKWTKVELAVHPSAREHHEMVYDPRRGKIVLFGGWDHTTVFGDTWEYGPQVTYASDGHADMIPVTCPARIKSARLISFSKSNPTGTSASILVSNDGANYYDITHPGSLAEFQGGTNNLYVRLELSTQVQDITPAVSGYSIQYETDAMLKHVVCGPFTGSFSITKEVSLLADKTVREHLSGEISSLAAQYSVSPDFISISLPRISDSRADLDTFLSLDGKTEYFSPSSKPYGRYQVKYKVYSGSFSRSVDVTSKSGVIKLSDIILKECILKDEAGNPYPPLVGEPRFQAKDIFYTLTNTSDWPCEITFEDGTVRTYNNLQAVVAIIPYDYVGERIKAFKSGIGDLNDLYVKVQDPDEPLNTGFKLVMDGMKTEARAVYPKIDAVVEAWATGTKSWANDEQDVVYKVFAHPVRDVSFRISSEVTTYREFLCTLKAILTCTNPSYTKEFAIDIPAALFRDQRKKPVVTASLQEIYSIGFEQQIQQEISTQGLDPNSCSVAFRAESNDTLIDVMLSEDGISPSDSGSAKIWAVLKEDSVNCTLEADLFVPDVSYTETISSFTPSMISDSSNIAVVDGHLELAKTSSGDYYSEGYAVIGPITASSRVESCSLPFVSMSEPYTPPQKADIVWIIDGSGSMGDNQQSIASNAQAFISKFIEAGADFRIGVVAYCINSLPINTDGTDGTPGAGVGQWTTDAQTFGTMVTSVGISRDDGGTEKGMAALRNTLSHYTFRPDARKYFIIVTDEDADDASTMAETVNLMLSNGVTVYAVYNPAEPAGYAGPDAPPAATGGGLYDITSADWGNTLAVIANEILESFTKVSIYVSNDGINYVGIEPLGTASFSGGENELYIKFVLKSGYEPGGSSGFGWDMWKSTPTVSGYTVSYTVDGVTRHVSSPPFEGLFYVTTEDPQLLSGLTVREHLAGEISAMASDLGIEESKIVVQEPSVLADRTDIDVFLSADGSSPLSSESSRIYGKYHVSKVRYSGSVDKTVRASALSGVMPLTSIILEECVLRNSGGAVYPPLSGFSEIQAFDVPYTVTNLSPSISEVAFEDGSTFTYNNLQPVVGRVLGSEESQEQMMHIVYPNESSASLPVFNVAQPCEYELSIVSASDNAVLCFEQTDGTRTASTAESSSPVTSDPGARIVGWIPKRMEIDLSWESEHKTVNASLNGDGPLLAKKDAEIKILGSDIVKDPNVKDIYIHARLLSAWADKDVLGSVRLFLNGTDASSIGPMSYEEASSAAVFIRLSSDYSKESQVAVPTSCVVYESPEQYTIYPGEETVLEVLPKPQPPDWMQRLPSPKLKAVPTRRGVYLYVRELDSDTIEVAGLVRLDPASWNPLIHRGWYYFNNEERYLFAEPKELLISPNPSAFIPGLKLLGAPIIVEDPEDPAAEFRMFWGEKYGRPNPKVTEELFGNGTDTLYLAYDGVYSVELTGPGGPITDFYVSGHKVTLLSGVFQEGLVYKVSYKLDRSFVVDYTDDGAELIFDRPYGNLKVTYEASEESPYYCASEVSLSLLVNPMNSGFLRITDTEYPIREIEATVSPNPVEADGISPVNVIVRILDSNRNPMENKQVVLESPMGNFSARTDQYGGTSFVLTSPGEPGEYRITVRCLNLVKDLVLRCH